MKKLAVITSGRADYGLVRPIMKGISRSKKLELQVFVTGAHLSPDYGNTHKEIEADGFVIDERIQSMRRTDTPEDVARSMGLTTQGFSKAFARTRPDMILVLGDRYEIFAAASAAVAMGIAIAHVHGGETTVGSVDEIFRHCLTKMSHLHFVSCEQYANRVIQLGEEPWRVTVSGAPGLDNFKDFTPYSPGEFRKKFDIPIRDDFLMVTFHPESVHPEHTRYQIETLLSALENIHRPLIFTYPNEDAAGKTIIRALRRYCISHDEAWLAVSLGTRGYASLMSRASAMVGNSSSGIIEAASFKLPVVNIGIRQQGRLKPQNVLDAPTELNAIIKAINKAISPSFRSLLRNLKNPFGDGRAVSRIIRVIEQSELNETFLLKRFHDLKQRQGALQCG